MFSNMVIINCMKMPKKIEVTQSKVAIEEFAAREYALTRVLGPDTRGRCHGVGIGFTPTNLFGNNTYKEALVASQARAKDYAKQVSSLKSSMLKIMKRLEAMEKEHVVKNQNSSINFFYAFNVHLYTQIILILISHY